MIFCKLLKGRQTPLSNSKNVNVAENAIDFYFRKWNLIFRFTWYIKNLPTNTDF